MFFRFPLLSILFLLFGSFATFGSELPPVVSPMESPLPESIVGALTVFADGDESLGDLPLRVRLDVEVLAGTGVPPYRYRWDFGDGTAFSDLASPVHIYRVPGSFRASVIVVDARNEVDQDYVDIAVHEPLNDDTLSARELRAWVLSNGDPDAGVATPAAGTQPPPTPAG